MICPTCGSDDRDIFWPIVARISRCKDPWHENRIVKLRPKPRNAASRQGPSFWPEHFVTSYMAQRFS